MHETRLRNHGNVNTILKKNVTSFEYIELSPDGTIIRDPKKWENIELIIKRLTKNMLLGYATTDDDVCDIIKKVIDDRPPREDKNGYPIFGARTQKYHSYIQERIESPDGRKHGLLLDREAKWLDCILNKLVDKCAVKRCEEYLKNEWKYFPSVQVERTINILKTNQTFLGLEFYVEDGLEYFRWIKSTDEIIQDWKVALNDNELLEIEYFTYSSNIHKGRMNSIKQKFKEKMDEELKLE